MSITSTGLSDYELETVTETAASPDPKDKQPPPTSLETMRSVARRLNRSVRTVDRYIGLGILPEPLRIRGKRFLPAGTMPRYDAT